MLTKNTLLMYIYYNKSIVKIYTFIKFSHFGLLAEKRGIVFK